MSEIFCTVFTPAYNRSELMLRLYESLCMQQVKNFEWVIVDDGSTDKTEEIFAQLTDPEFRIIYKKVSNGGKHRAINHGLSIASGKVFAIVDSDDYLTSDATRRIEEYFSSIEFENKKFAGVAAQKCYNHLDAVGTTFKGEFVDATSLERSRYNINGDKFEIFYTDVLKANPFPEIDGEKFLSEAVVWNRIAAQGYCIRWYNDKLYICDYLEGGLTDGREKCFEKSPKGYLLYINELVKFGALSFKQKMGHYSLYYKIRRKYSTLKRTAAELGISTVLLWIMYCLRVIIDSVRKSRRKNA